MLHKKRGQVHFLSDKKMNLPHFRDAVLAALKDCDAKNRVAGGEAFPPRFAMDVQMQQHPRRECILAK
jgi:hypothetical protein